MSLAALTVPEARAVLIADDALHLSRLPSGQTFGIDEREAWTQFVESATDRIAAFESTNKYLEPDRYRGGNAPDFQTLALEADAAVKSSSETEAQALRTGIETIVRAFGTPSAGWTQQFRALLDRVPVTIAGVDGEAAR